MSQHEILMEIQKIGSILRVCAVDADTGTEIVFQAPTSTPRRALEKLAAQKLHYVLKNTPDRISE